MSSRQLLFEDLLGNIPDLEKIIKSAAISRNWDPDWSVNINQSQTPEELATINIYVKINSREFIRDLVIFKAENQPLSNIRQSPNTRQSPNSGFSIQWGFVPHPIIPIIHDWLEKVDTSIERSNKRNSKIKIELIETTLHPNNFFKFSDGI